MRFDIITLFPEVFEPYFNESILGRAKKKGLIKIQIHNLRNFSKDGKRGKIDDRVYGGGPGMVIQAEPLIKAVEHAKKKNKKGRVKIILLSPAGKQFDNKMAQDLSGRYSQIILICGHYEGVDERIKRIFRIGNVTIGPYVLSGGELPAMVIVDAVSRRIKGALGKYESLEEKRFGVGVPVYTRPETFKYNGKSYSIPKVLKSGNHKEISAWRTSHINQRTNKPLKS
jgi:tRNA (guanine37-N1)-methyltransferase